jgi:hypothetical protein
VGEISDVVDTESGVHIIKRTGWLHPRQYPYTVETGMPWRGYMVSCFIGELVLVCFFSYALEKMRCLTSFCKLRWRPLVWNCAHGHDGIILFWVWHDCMSILSVILCHSCLREFYIFPPRMPLSSVASLFSYKSIRLIIQPVGGRKDLCSLCLGSLI